MLAVELFVNKILQFLTGGVGRLMRVDLYNGLKTVIVAGCMRYDTYNVGRCCRCLSLHAISGHAIDYLSPGYRCVIQVCGCCDL